MSTDPRQPSFFEIPKPPVAGPESLNVEADLRASLARAIQECAKGRPQIAAEMTVLLFGEAAEKGEVTVHMLNAWTAPSRDAWRFPLGFLPAFVRVTGATWLLDWVAELCGCRVMVGDEALLAELGAIALVERHYGKRRRAIERALPASLQVKFVNAAGGGTGER